MSDSIKKHPSIRNHRGQKWAKRQASKAVRKVDVGNGKAYRKVYESWNIYDQRKVHHYTYTALVAWAKRRYVYPGEWQRVAAWYCSK